MTQVAVRWLFFDFSSKFRDSKFMRMEVDALLVSWMTNYLTCRPQHIRLQYCISDTVVSSRGAPQGTVLSPFMFTLYTSDFNYSSETCHLQRFSDDSAIVGFINR